MSLHPILLITLSSLLFSLLFDFLPFYLSYHPPPLSPHRPLSYVPHISFHPPFCQYPPLKAGDMVKIDLGSHMDGYIVVAAHTIIVKAAAEPGEESNPPVFPICNSCMLTLLISHIRTVSLTLSLFLSPSLFPSSSLLHLSIPHFSLWHTLSLPLSIISNALFLFRSSCRG